MRVYFSTTKRRVLHEMHARRGGCCDCGVKTTQRNPKNTLGMCLRCQIQTYSIYLELWVIPMGFICPLSDIFYFILHVIPWPFICLSFCFPHSIDFLADNLQNGIILTYSFLAAQQCGVLSFPHYLEFHGLKLNVTFPIVLYFIQTNHGWNHLKAPKT